MKRIEELESRVGELDAELTDLLEETELEPEADEEGKEKALSACAGAQRPEIRQSGFTVSFLIVILL